MRREFPPQCVAAEISAAGSSRYSKTFLKILLKYLPKNHHERHTTRHPSQIFHQMHQTNPQPFNPPPGTNEGPIDAANDIPNDIHKDIPQIQYPKANAKTNFLQSHRSQPKDMIQDNHRNMSKDTPQRQPSTDPPRHPLTHSATIRSKYILEVIPEDNFKTTETSSKDTFRKHTQSHRRRRRKTTVKTSLKDTPLQKHKSFPRDIRQRHSPKTPSSSKDIPGSRSPRLPRDLHAMLQKCCACDVCARVSKVARLLPKYCAYHESLQSGFKALRLPHSLPICTKSSGALRLPRKYNLKSSKALRLSQKVSLRRIKARSKCCLSRNPAWTRSPRASTISVGLWRQNDFDRFWRAGCTTGPTKMTLAQTPARAFQARHLKTTTREAQITMARRRTQPSNNTAPAQRNDTQRR